MSERLHRMLLFLFISVILVGVPSLIVYSSIVRYFFLAEEQHRAKMAAVAAKTSVRAKLDSDQEIFWCRRLHEKYLRISRHSTSVEEVEHWLKEERRRFDNEFDYLIWDTSGNIYSKTFLSEFSAADWKGLFSTLAANFGFARTLEYTKDLKSDFELAKRMLGEQFLPAFFRFNFDERGYSLAYTDSSMSRPAYFSFFIDSCGVFLAFDFHKFKHLSGLKSICSDLAASENYQIGLYRSNSEERLWKTYAHESWRDLAEILSICEQQGLTFYQRGDEYLFTHFIQSDLHLFFRARQLRSNFEIHFLALVGATMVFLLLIPVFKFLFKTMILQLPGDVSLRFRLAFLFLFASGIPLLVLGIMSHENYIQKREDMILRACRETNEMVLSFDRRFSAFSSSMSYDLLRFLKKNLSGPDLKIDRKFSDLVIGKLEEKKAGAYYLVSSNTSELISNYGFLRMRGSLEDSQVDDANSELVRTPNPSFKSDHSAANLIGKKLLSDLNNSPFPLATVSKLELVAETLMQKPFVEILQSVISGFETLSLWGFGRTMDYGFSCLISLNDDSIYDFLLLAFWRPMEYQTFYINENLEKAGKNNRNIRLVAIRNVDDYLLPERITVDADFWGFSRTLSERPGEDFQIMRVDGEDYVAVGVKGLHLDKFKLVGLFPLGDIETGILQQRSDIMLFSVLCILFSLGLAQILFRSFLKPIEALKQGALAIEARNFDHRIKGVARDEFGKISDIFNNVMVGFEELEVAKVVQESLFPSPAFSHGRFRVFGRSVTMAELGGDYFDYIGIDDEKFAILMGDVAGHGVGAAVIMAMAKAAIINSSHLLEQPSDLLLQLHRMILASKSSKQRKVMTFQYLFVDSVAGRGIYSNAGACSPMLIRKNDRSVSELTLAGPALGAFKKAAYQNCELAFQPGDAIVFYTDGIVETRNSEGEEIGYHGFKTILSESWDSDPEIFYNRVFARYREHLGDLDPQDDLTFMIMICHEKSL